MKSIMKWIFVVLGVLLLAVLSTVGAVYVGWIPVPGWVVASVAQAKGMSPSEEQSLNKVAGVYQIVRSAPEGKLIDQALAMANGNTSGADWVNFAKTSWPKVGAETKGKIRDQLGIEASDFEKLDRLITDKVSKAEDPDKFRLTVAETAFLKSLDAKYGISELLAKLRS
jgi:hypothetical protein